MAFSNFILTHWTIDRYPPFFAVIKEENLKKGEAGKKSPKNTSIIMRRICINVVVFFTVEMVQCDFQTTMFRFVRCCLFPIDKQAGQRIHTFAAVA